jgi:hypothetical protein
MQVLVVMYGMTNSTPSIPGGELGLLLVAALCPWLVVAPAAAIAHLFRVHSLAQGLWIGGAVGSLLVSLCWWTFSATTTSPKPDTLSTVHVQGPIAELVLPESRSATSVTGKSTRSP